MSIGKMPEKVLHVAFCIAALLLAAFLSALIPPMQSPDENSHIARAYLISQGNWLLQELPTNFGQPDPNEETAAFIDRARKQGGHMGGMVDQGLLKFIDGYLTLAGKPDKRISVAEKKQLAELDWTSKRGFSLLPGTGYYFPAIYIPQATGLAMGQLLHLSVEHSYQLASGITILVCFFVLWFAIKLAPPNPLVVAVLLLPMSLFQLVSPTLDGLTTSLAVLTISLFLRAASFGPPPSAGASVGLALCVFLLATSRTHLLVLLALPFYVALHRQSRRDLYLGCAVTVSAIAWTLFALQTTTDLRIVRQQSTVDLLIHYGMNPLAFFKAIFSSLSDPGLFTFYKQSFIGVLGWLDAPLVGNFYPYLWAGMALSAAVSVSVAAWQKDWSMRVLLAVLALISGSMIFLALLVTWTPHPTVLVQGVQGRYFLVPAILLSYSASGLTVTKSKMRKWLSFVTMVGFAMLSVTALTMTLLNRYH